jgi:hypothetical protein
MIMIRLLRTACLPATALPLLLRFPSSKGDGRKEGKSLFKRAKAEKEAPKHVKLNFGERHPKNQDQQPAKE